MPTLNPAIFKAYDIRGLVPAELDADSANLVGRALGSLLPAGGRRIGVGRDNRLPPDPAAPGSSELSAALVNGLLSAGCQVYDFGAVPTPVLYFSALAQGLDAGVMVTGSHNPRQYNGMKISLHDRAAGRLVALDTRQVLAACQDPALLARSTAGGARAAAGPDYTAEILERYAAFICARLAPAARPLQVVVDPGNAVGGVIGPRLLERLGHRVEVINGELDGTFPDHTPNPEQAKNLQSLRRQVLASRADFGVAYDGDADRLGMVGADGEKISADLLLLLLARDVLQRQPGAKIVFDGLCSQALVEDITRRGGVALRSQTGYTAISRRMFAEGALLAGEISGHIFFRDRGFWGYDDGILAACRFLELAAQLEAPVADVLSQAGLWSVMEQKRPSCPAELKKEVIAAVTAAFRQQGAEIQELDGVWATFRSGPQVYGRIVIRAASTEDSLSIMCEGRTPAERQQLEAQIDSLLGEIMGPLWAGLMNFDNQNR